jgi:hypothetical protein
MNKNQPVIPTPCDGGVSMKIKASWRGGSLAEPVEIKL